MLFAEGTSPETSLVAVAVIGGLGLLALFVYFGPFLCALVRRHNSAAAIFLTCLLLGWTGIGWVVALIWAYSDPGPD